MEGDYWCELTNIEGHGRFGMNFREISLKNTPLLRTRALFTSLLLMPSLLATNRSICLTNYQVREEAKYFQFIYFFNWTGLGIWCLEQNFWRFLNVIIEIISILKFDRKYTDTFFYLFIWQTTKMNFKDFNGLQYLYRIQ